MSLPAAYKKAWSELSANVVPMWIMYYIASITAFVLFIPWAGHFSSYLKLQRQKQKPDFADLFSQFDHVGSLAILFVIFLATYFVLGVVLMVTFMISSTLGTLLNLALMLIIGPCLFMIVTYAICLIFDQGKSPIVAIKSSLNHFTNHFKNEYILGIGFLVMNIPLGLGGPIALHAILENYGNHFKK